MKKLKKIIALILLAQQLNTQWESHYILLAQEKDNPPVILIRKDKNTGYWDVFSANGKTDLTESEIARKTGEFFKNQIENNGIFSYQQAQNHLHEKSKYRSVDFDSRTRNENGITQYFFKNIYQYVSPENITPAGNTDQFLWTNLESFKQAKEIKDQTGKPLQFEQGLREKVMWYFNLLDQERATRIAKQEKEKKEKEQKEKAREESQRKYQEARMQGPADWDTDFFPKDKAFRFEPWSTDKFYKQLIENTPISQEKTQELDKVATALYEKIRKDKNLQNLLMNTDNKIIIYDAHEAPLADDYWGVGEYYKGKNHLGQILTQIRDTLAAHQIPQKFTYQEKTPDQYKKINIQALPRPLLRTENLTLKLNQLSFELQALSQRL